MVATWTPAASSSYYTQQTEYYLANGEPNGYWYSPSDQFNIVDGAAVHAHQFENLFAGLDVNHQHLLPPHSQRADRIPAFDYTFSSPRSVALLWAFGSIETRTAIEQAQARAVRASLDLLGREATYARRGRGGNIYERIHFSAACFQHGDSRPAEHSDGRVFGDMNTHSHCVILNLAQRADGSVGALHSTVLRDWKMAAGAAYHAALAYEMQQLGFAIDRVAYNGVFEIAGIDDAAIRYFSARREEIEDELTSADTTSGDAPQLAAAIAKSTRASKQSQVLSDRTQIWIDAARDNGIAVDQLEQRARAYAHLHRDKNLTPKLSGNLTIEQILCLKKELTTTASVFDRRDLVRTVNASLVGQGFTPTQITQLIDQLIEHGDVVTLGHDAIGQARYSTPERIALEREIVSAATRLARSSWHSIAPADIQRQCAARGLSNEQTQAALLACASSRIAIIEGAPGSGKTTTLAPIVAAYEEAGCRVIGGAQAWRIAQMLSDDLTIESRSTASWLYRASNDHDFLDARTLVVIDEAGLLSSPDTHTLLHAVEKSGAKLLLVGDRQQLQAIGGAAGLSLVTRAVDHARVSTIVRQRDAWIRESITAIGQGDVKTALTAFKTHDRWIEVQGARAAIQSVADQWAALREQHPERNSLLLAKTNREAQCINREIRARLRAENRVHGPDISIEAATPSGHFTRIELATGDQIRFLTRNDQLGVINGTTATVIRVSGPAQTTDLRSQRIHADVEGRQISFNPADLADEKGRARLGWAYASTIYGSQGLTVDHAVVLVNPAFDRHDLYVAASRARQSTTLVADTKAIDQHIRLQQPENYSRADSIADHERDAWLATRLSRVNVKESTLDVIELDQLDRAAQHTLHRQPELEEVALEH